MPRNKSKLIRTLRRKRELSQADVAEVIGISQSYYCQFELGHVKLKPYEVEAVHRYLLARLP